MGDGLYDREHLWLQSLDGQASAPLLGSCVLDPKHTQKDLQLFTAVMLNVRILSIYKQKPKAMNMRTLCGNPVIICKVLNTIRPVETGAT